MSIEWHEVFETGEVEKGMPRAWAVATALGGWGCCMSGNGEVPENFGKGMQALTFMYDIPSLPDELSRIAKKLKPNDYKNDYPCRSYEPHS